LPPVGTHITFRLFTDNGASFFGDYPPPYRLGIIATLVPFGNRLGIIATPVPFGNIVFAEHDPWDGSHITRVWMANDVEEWQSVDEIGSPVPRETPVNDNQLHDGHTDDNQLHDGHTVQ
jgi:hypothetical protein